MARRRITSYDVARAAGVSQTTVSFVLNRVAEANISNETRQRVMAAAEELGYIPDAAAQALVRGRTQIIGVVVTTLRTRSLGLLCRRSSRLRTIKAMSSSWPVPMISPSGRLQQPGCFCPAGWMV